VARERGSQWLWMAVQFAVSVGAGCAVYAWMMRDPKVTTGPAVFGGFLVGLVATRAVMFGVTWVRFGWRTARSMRMS
jgi:hypothetical protein